MKLNLQIMVISSVTDIYRQRKKRGRSRSTTRLRHEEVLGHCQLTIFLGKLKGKLFNIHVVYAPTAQSIEEEIDKFYCILPRLNAN